MPASKQSGALKVALPLIAALLLGTMIFGPSLFAPQSAKNQQQPNAQAPTDQEGEDTAASTDGTITPTEDARDVEADPGDMSTPEADADVPPTPAPTTTDADTPTEGTPTTDAGTDVSPAMTPAPDGEGLPSAWTLRTFDAGAATSSIGSIDPASGYELLVEIDPAGVGIERAAFANHYQTAKQAQAVRHGEAPQPDWHYDVRALRPAKDPQFELRLNMVDARAVFVRDTQTGVNAFFDLTSDRVWERTGPGAYSATLLDAQGAEAMVIRRRFALDTGSYDIRVEQSVENRTDRALEIVWYQYGPSDLPPETSGYRIETRRVRVGFTTQSDPQYVSADSEVRDLPKVVKLATQRADKRRQIWPEDVYDDAGQLAWVAQTNRHFMFVVHPMLAIDAATSNVDDPRANPIDKSFALGAGKVLAEGLSSSEVVPEQADPFDKHVEIAMQSAPVAIAPGATADLSFGVFLGPLNDDFLSAKNDPRYAALNLADAVIYQIGYCGFCTFQWIARPLLWLLRFFEGNVVFDWGIAIILLVVCVRAALHPITKKSQVSMMRFGKQMQRLAPKQQKIKERYKDDRQRMNQELAKLMREEQINPLGMLGCLPLFLQTPIWIALYATIYFAFDLRHQPAFFGVFQQMGGWTFLNDLSSPDHFIDFGEPLFTIPLMGAISGFNLLPLVMGAVFFVQQKYMSPPPSGNMSPEQEQTQKLMKVMLVVMMPVFMYNAPSGLTLYILTSSTLGVLESRYIRAHVDAMDLEEPAKKKPAHDGRKKVANAMYKREQEPRRHFKPRDKK